MFILIFLVILTVLVLIHEAGHYFVARWFGIKVEEFGFGFPPRAWGKKIGETLYSINWLPIGGFVKLYGEDEAGAGSVKLSHKEEQYKDRDRAFFARPVSQRALVVLAGVLMNVLLAAAIYYLYLGLSGFNAELPAIIDHKFFGAEQHNRLDGLIVADVASNSPASHAGLRKCDQNFCANITAINGVKIQSSESFQNTVKANRGKEITITYQDVSTKKSTTVSVVPRVNPPKGEGALGIGFGVYETTVLEYQTPMQKTFSGIVHPANLMVYQYAVLKSLVHNAMQTHDYSTLSSAVSGPVGIAKLTKSIVEIPTWKERILQLLNLAGLLSISLAFFNVLPIPALDGGRLFFILIEGVTRHKVSPRIEGYIHTAGMVVLLALIVLITFKDIFIH